MLSSLTSSRKENLHPAFAESKRRTPDLCSWTSVPTLLCSVRIAQAVTGMGYKYSHQKSKCFYWIMFTRNKDKRLSAEVWNLSAVSSQRRLCSKNQCVIHLYQPVNILKCPEARLRVPPLHTHIHLTLTHAITHKPLTWELKIFCSAGRHFTTAAERMGRTLKQKHSADTRLQRSGRRGRWANNHQEQVSFDGQSCQREGCMSAK